MFKRARELRPNLNDCQVRITRPHVTTYTCHLAASPQNVRPFETHSYITTFELLLSDLVEFRAAEGELAHRCASALRVASFALGGVSTLSRLSTEEWDSLALRPVAEGAIAADLTREKYHLLPGLNWKSQVDSKQVLIEWICSIETIGKVLIFDTGTEGNAPRQISKLIRDRLPQCDTKANLEFEIVGIVDGNNPKSVPDKNEGRSRNGNQFIMTVNYLTVPRVLSEDFQSLMGCRKLDKGGYLEPLRDIGIIRVIHEGRLVQISATDNLANVFRGYMTNAIGGPQRLTREGREVLTPDVERALVEEVLEYACCGEVQELHTACAIGLVSEHEARFLLNEIDARYLQELQEFPRHVWSFIEKKILVKPIKLYEVLRDVARERRVVPYSELSKLYHGLMGDHPKHPKEWGTPLRQMNVAAAAAKLPPLSAVVACSAGETWPGTDAHLPMISFWGSANVPAWPETRESRDSAWRDILKAVHQATWPDKLPGLE